MRFQTNKQEGHIRLVADYQEIYDVVIEPYAADKFTQLLFSKNIKNFINGKDITSNSIGRRREIFNLIFNHYPEA